MIAIVCPGQGSQTPGFLTPWLELAHFAESIDLQQEASGLNLRGFGTTADADTIRDTAVAQPLIVAAGVATLASLFETNELSGKTLANAGVYGIAGHSVGEITAAVASGVFSVTDGIRFVRERGNAMAKAAALEVTSMAAVLGGDQAAVEARLADLGLEPANYNGAGQIVAAGSAAAIAALVESPVAGTRVVPLQVAGAFHTRFMAAAVDTLAAYAGQVSVANPGTTLWSNHGGKIVDSGADFVSLLVSQVKSPVRWDLCMNAMVAAGVTAIVEVAPAGTLTGLAKRGMPGVETLAIKTPEQLDAARVLIANHSAK